MSSSSFYSRGCIFFQRKEEKFFGWNHSIEGKEEKERRIKRRKEKQERNRPEKLVPVTDQLQHHLLHQLANLLHHSPLPFHLILILSLPLIHSLDSICFLSCFFSKIGKMKENEPGCISFEVTIDSLVRRSRLIDMKLQSLRRIENCIMSESVKVLHFLSFSLFESENN